MAIARRLGDFCCWIEEFSRRRMARDYACQSPALAGLAPKLLATNRVDFRRYGRYQVCSAHHFIISVEAASILILWLDCREPSASISGLISPMMSQFSAFLPISRQHLATSLSSRLSATPMAGRPSTMNYLALSPSVTASYAYGVTVRRAGYILSSTSMPFAAQNEIDLCQIRCLQWRAERLEALWRFTLSAALDYAETR